MIVRINRARFDPASADRLRDMLDGFQETLVPALRRLPGFRTYQSGLDAASGSMVAVSTWDTAEHAAAVGTLPEMVAQAAALRAAGVAFEPPVHHEILWEI